MPKAGARRCLQLVTVLKAAGDPQERGFDPKLVFAVHVTGRTHPTGASKHVAGSGAEGRRNVPESVVEHTTPFGETLRGLPDGMMNEIGTIAEPSHSEELLKPYVPRVQIQWLRDAPETSHRAIDGSLAFVDISGFTELTERLARRGKIGAELLATLLTECSATCSTQRTRGARGW